MAKLPVRKYALNALIGSLVLSGALGIVALLVDQFGELQAKVLLTSLTVSATSILALSSATALERDRFAVLAKAGIGVTGVAAVLILVTIWLEVDTEDYLRVLASFSTASIALALCSLLSLALLIRKFEWVRNAAFVFSALLALALIQFYWTELDEQWFWRLIGILSILVTVATILVPIFHKMSAMQLRASRLLTEKVNLDDVFESITEYWSPVVIAALATEHVVRAAKVKGDFPEHSHANQDEFFLVVKGELRIRFSDHTETLRAGEGLLVPAGVAHQPHAETETHILLFEPESTKPKGN